MKRLLAFITLMLFAQPLFAEGTFAGTPISNGGDDGVIGTPDAYGDTILTCTLEYPGFSIDFSTASNVVSVKVSTGYAAAVSAPDLDKNILPGGTAYYPITITNRANDRDTLTFEVAVSNEPWAASFVQDTNGDGVHQVGETTPAVSPVTLEPDEDTRLFLHVSVPAAGTAGEFSTAQVTVKNQNGTGAEDHWRNDGNDTIIFVATTTCIEDATPPEVVYSSANPSGTIGMIGNRVVISAGASDTETGITAVELHFRIDTSSTQVISMPLSGGAYTLDIGGLITQPGTLVYSVHAKNGAGLETAAPERTCAFGTNTSGGQVTSGKVQVEDGNPGDGNTSLVIPSGALLYPITLSFVQESTASVASAAGGLAATARPVSAFEIGPSGTVFSRPVALTLLYFDLDNDGREDSTGVDETALRIFWWDGVAWRFLGGDVDPERNTVTVPVMHFSLFAVFPANAPAANDMRPAEKIITPNGDGINDFAAFGLTGQFTIKIFNANGRTVRTLDNVNIWDGKDDLGSVVESGAYLYQFKVDGKLLSGVIVVAK